MRIYRMTATFGKLEHQTLTLEPGLNVITAPNEWGKSTWCAFLVAMLYGVDTRSKSTKTAIADKERYQPWSGAPMEGRMDLNWNGRDITIERKTRGRIPMGDFQAYETKTGIPVPELNGANCGAMLLGVEQTVFRRAGFIRHADLPVTQDEALRRRLNDLVTTGDESGDADRLADTLRELKNRCRYNRTGLLPQAETERDALKARISELEALEGQCRGLKGRIEEVKSWISQLQNHRQALEYAQQQETARRVEAAGEELEKIRAEQNGLEQQCAVLPPRDEAQQRAEELRVFQQQWDDAQRDQQSLPKEPVAPLAPMPFEGMHPEDARKMARKDGETFVAVRRTGMPILLIVMGILGMVAAGLLVFLKAYPFAAVAGVGAVAAVVWGTWELVSLKKKARALLDKYGDDDYARWASPLIPYERELRQYYAALKQFKERSGAVHSRIAALEQERERLCAQEDPRKLQEHWNQVIGSWDACYAARREAVRAQNHFDALNSLIRPVEAPAMPDYLSHTMEETEKLLTECTVEQQRLQNRLGQYQGRMEVLGDGDVLKKQLAQKHRRIAKLEETYAALVIAQDTLARAREELQRRFAPRITRRAQKLLMAMTGGRYNMVTMGVDFSLQARAEQEDTLREALWRSDGTMDQLYLALRLAVAEELTPEAPLILDDVLVRFDDQRMKAAVGMLKEMAKEKQVILFSCQGRETKVK